MRLSEKWNSLEDDEEWREFGTENWHETDVWQDEKHNWDWPDQTDRTEKTVRFEELLDARGLLTGALDIDNSEWNFSS